MADAKGLDIVEFILVAAIAAIFAAGVHACRAEDRRCAVECKDTRGAIHGVLCLCPTVSECPAPAEAK